MVKEKNTSLKDAVSHHASAFKKLKADLAEAKHERIFDNRIRGSKLKLYDAAIGSLARLAQHLNGLRSSTKLQESIIRASRDGKFASTAMTSDFAIRSMSLPSARAAQTEDPAQAEMMAAIRLLTRFRELAGAQMDDLTVGHQGEAQLSELIRIQSRCDDVLGALQTLSLDTGAQVNIPRLRDRLSVALRDFNLSATRAIKRLYAGPKREKELHHDQTEDSENGEGDEGPNETVFLVYL